jgi:hypothetical protein
MSKCGENISGQKHRHLYEDPKVPNKCSKCSHVTKHGKRFRMATKTVLPEKP